MILKQLQNVISRSLHCLAISVIFVIASNAPQGVLAQTEKIEPIVKMIEIDGAVLSVDIWDGGTETIIALPGLGFDTEYFHILAPKIAAEGYNFVAVNPRGIRGSQGAIDELTLTILANDVASLIEALDIKQAHLLGWAFGNRVARATAVKHPNNIATVTLLAAGGKVPAKPEAQEAISELFTSPNLDTVTRNKLMTVALFSPKSDAQSILQSMPSKRWLEAVRAQVKASRSVSLDSWWGGGNLPMNVIQGLDDIAALPENGYMLKEEFPERVQIVDIKDAGHMLLIEKPDEVAKATVEYLNAHRIE